MLIFVFTPTTTPMPCAIASHRRLCWLIGLDVMSLVSAPLLTLTLRVVIYRLRKGGEGGGWLLEGLSFTSIDNSRRRLIIIKWRRRSLRLVVVVVYLWERSSEEERISIFWQRSRRHSRRICSLLCPGSAASVLLLLIPISALSHKSIPLGWSVVRSG